MKLYIVFDKIKLEKDNSRKCMIELRPGVSGNYKGLIFCNSIRETEIILNQVKKILTNGSKSLLTVKEAYQFEWREQNNLGKAQYSKRPRRQ